MAGGANMGESGFKVDPFSVNALMDPLQRLTNSLVAKDARERRRKIIADKKAKRCAALNSNVITPIIEDSVVAQTARAKRRQILAARRAMRCTTIRSSQQTETNGDKDSRSTGENLQNDLSEASVKKSLSPVNANKK